MQQSQTRKYVHVRKYSPALESIRKDLKTKARDETQIRFYRVLNFHIINYGNEI
jgi:hypothetical protein